MTDLADCHGDRIATTEARSEGFYWVVLGRNPPEIAYWERGEWCGVIIAPDGIQAEGKMSSTMQDGLMWRCVACGERNFNHYENCVSCGRARLAGDDERRQRPLGVQAAPGTGRMTQRKRTPAHDFRHPRIATASPSAWSGGDPRHIDREGGRMIELPARVGRPSSARWAAW